MREIVNTQLKAYKAAINLKIDYKMENLEEWLNEKHEMVSNSSIEEFLKGAEHFNDESRKLRFKAMLEQEFEINFEVWRASSLNSQQQVKNEQSMMSNVIAQLRTYMDIMNKEVDNSLENFETSILELHLKSKTAAVEGFLKTNIEDKADEATYKDILEKEVDATFEGWKVTKLKENAKFKELHQLASENQMRALMADQVNKYSAAISTVPASIESQANFSQLLDSKHQSFKEGITESFLQAKKIDKAAEAIYLAKLEKEIEIVWSHWRQVKLAEMKSVASKADCEVQALVYKHFEDYKVELRLENDFKTENYETYIKGKHATIAKETFKRLKKALLGKYTSKQLESNQNLSDLIEKTFNIWFTWFLKINKAETKLDQLQSELAISSYASKKLNSYNGLLRQRNSNNEAIISVQELLDDFSQDTSRFNDPQVQTKYRNSLSTEATNSLNTWQKCKNKENELIEKFNQQQLKELNAIASKYVSEFKLGMMKKNDYANYKLMSVFYEKYLIEKLSALTNYGNAISHFENNNNKNKARNTLSKDINEAYNELYEEVKKRHEGE